MSTDLITLIYLCHHAFIAQLDRAFVYGTKGLGFESLWTHQILNLFQLSCSAENKKYL